MSGVETAITCLIGMIVGGALTLAGAWIVGKRQ